MTAPAAPPAPAPPIPPPIRTRRGVLIAAVLIVLFVIGNGAVQLTSEFLNTWFSQSSTIVPLAPQVTVIGHRGDVTVTASPDGNVHVTVSGKYGAARPVMTEDSTDTGVLLEARCGDIALVSCQVDYSVQVPPAFAVKVQGGSTDVSVRNLSGAVDVDLEAGSTEVSNTTGPLRLHTGFGHISGYQLRSTAITATTPSGEVYLDVLAAPQSLAVDAGSGSVSIFVPGEYTYRVAGSSSSGSRSVGVAQDAASTRSITATTESGDVRIRGRGRLQVPLKLPEPPEAPDAPAAPAAPR